MSIALHKAALATEMYLTGNSVEQHNHRLRAQLNRGMDIAALLSRPMVTKAGCNLVLFGLSVSQMQCDGSRHQPAFRNRLLLRPRLFLGTEKSPPNSVKAICSIGYSPTRISARQSQGVAVAL